jgi:hypothetical protein
MRAAQNFVIIIERDKSPEARGEGLSFKKKYEGISQAYARRVFACFITMV